jgi:hypothetical protein
MTPTFRIARPTDHLEALSEMYAAGLGMARLGGFTDHDGFSGTMLGYPGAPYHLEFTAKDGHVAGRAPTEDNLLVLYVEDEGEWSRRCDAMVAAGFAHVAAFNPYWEHSGRTYEDLDGYRVVIQHGAWPRVL